MKIPRIPLANERIILGQLTHFTIFPVITNILPLKACPKSTFPRLNGIPDTDQQVLDGIGSLLATGRTPQRLKVKSLDEVLPVD